MARGVASVAVIDETATLAGGFGSELHPAARASAAVESAITWIRCMIPPDFEQANVTWGTRATREVGVITSAADRPNLRRTTEPTGDDYEVTPALCPRNRR